MVQGAQQKYDDNAAKVAKLMNELKAAQQALEDSRRGLEAAKMLETIVQEIDLKIRGFQATYVDEKKKEFGSMLVGPPQHWGENNYGSFRPETLGEWLRGKIALGSEDVATYLQRFLDAGGKADFIKQTAELKRNVYAQFAEMLVQHLPTDDSWPPYEVVVTDGYLIIDASIRFANR